MLPFYSILWADCGSLVLLSIGTAIILMKNGIGFLYLLILLNGKDTGSKEPKKDTLVVLPKWI